MKKFFKKVIMSLMSDKDFLNMIISIFEVLAKNTSNNFDDKFIEFLKAEADKMSGNSLKSYE